MAILAFSSNNIFDSTSAGRALLTAADASAQRTLLGLSSSSAVSFQSLVLSGQSLTGSTATSVFDATTTWNTTGTPVAWKLNVTDTASGGNPLLIDLQANSSSRFDVTAKVAATYIGQFSHNGLPRVRFSAQSSGAAIEIFAGSSNSFIGFGTIGSTVSRLYAEDASNGIIGQRNGVNPQTFRVYNTFTDISNYERAKIAWESNVLVFGTEKLGTGASRAIQIHTGGAKQITIGSGGPELSLGSNASPPAIYAMNSIITNTASPTGQGIGFRSDVNDNDSYGFIFTGATGTITSSTLRVVQIERSFFPTSGTGNFTALRLRNQIQQTGGANGITRGIHVDPYIWAAADWRSIETSNNTGYAFYAAGTAVSYFGGNVGIGVAPSSFKLHIRHTGGDFIRLGISAANADTLEGGISWYTNEAVTADYFGGLRMRFQGGSGANNRQMQFLVGDLATPKVVITGQGFVGVGTNTPDRLFIVTGSNATGLEGALFYNSNTTSGAEVAVRLGVFNGANGLAFRQSTNATGPVAWASGSYDSFIQAGQSGSKLHFAAGGNTSPQVTLSGGNLGIGTTSPASLLDVTGQTNVAATIYLRNTNSAASALTTLSLVNSAGNFCSLYKRSPNAAADPHAMVFDVDNTSSTLAAMIFASSGVERMRISTTGSVGIGTNNPLARLHVKGSGTTFATFGINLEDSAGTHVFRVRDDGGIHIGPTTAATNGAFISASDGTDNNGTTTGSGLRYRSSLTISSTGSDHLFRNYQGSRTGTSGTSNLMEMNGGFAPTSGTGVYNFVRVVGTINQTGGSTGITRGIWVSPTLTAAADFRAIETENGSWRLNDTYAAGSGSLAGSALTINQTFNTTGAPTALALNITDTASATTGSTAAFTISTGGTARIMFHKSPAANGSIWGTVWITNNNNGVMVNPGSVTLGSNTLLQWTTSGVTSTTYSTPELVLAKDAANILAQRNGVNAQTFRVYNTYTDASNYERGKFAWNSNVLEIGTEALGTGTARDLDLQTNGITRFKLTAAGTGFGAVVSTSLQINTGSNKCLLVNGSSTASTGLQIVSSSRSWEISVAGTTPTGGDFANLSAGQFGIYDGTAGLFRLLIGTTGNVGIGNYAPAAKLDIADTTLSTGSNSGGILSLAQTWNTTGTPTAVKLNVTDTASNANSLLLDLQVGSVSMFKVAKTGRTDINGTLSTGGFNIFCGALMATSFIGVDSSGDTKFHRDAAGIFAQRNGVNAQALRVYNTYTDASNYERAKIAWESNALRIGTEKAGTGTARQLDLQTDGTTRISIAGNGSISTNNAITVVSGFIATIAQVGVSGSGTQYCYDAGTTTYSGASGATTLFAARSAFSPTSGTMTYSGFAFLGTINQTGGANGITRGLYINPTLTSAADWRAIEITAGKTIVAPSTTTSASLNIPSGTAPTSPVDGDIWFDGTALKIRIGGVTKTVTVT